MKRMNELQEAVGKLPRVSLGLYPTPLIEAVNLSSYLKGPRIFIKREDLCGIALGGNKCRHLEFILGHARHNGADAIVSVSGSQSNYCTLMAAGARKLGMKPSFILMKDIHPETQGNLLLHHLMESDVEIVDVPHEAVFGREISDKLDRIAGELKERGYHPFVIRHTVPDISTLLSSVGWVHAACEIFQQLKEQHIDAQHLVLATATGGTQSGLVLGLNYLGATCSVLGISAWKAKDEIESMIVKRVHSVSEFLNLDSDVTFGEVDVDDEHIGTAYGIPTKDCIEAIKLVAKTEGIVLDPVYTGKAMAGLIDAVKKGRFTSDDTVVFIHTGGIPILFAYDKEITRGVVV